jgi:ADP-dependent NAD(P)H-hydrate dehydratase / NAD(P)H-hydrate epimerase
MVSHPTCPAPRKAPQTGTSLRSPGATVVAVDCPSGLNCDTGTIDPAAIQANLTVTFAYPKVGHLRFPGAAAVGRLLVADIGIDPALAEEFPLELLTGELVARLLPRRPLDAHKGTFGKAMIVAGSVHYTGAAYLCAAAAARVGAGLVTAAVPRPLHPILASRLTEATWLLLPHDLGVVSADAVRVVKDGLAGYAAWLVGPGLTSEKEAVQFVHELLRPASARPAASSLGFLTTEAEKPVLAQKPGFSPPPLVLDADGLNALAQDDSWPNWLEGTPVVLTPHAGEMARLLHLTPEDVQARRWEHAIAAAQAWKQVVVLKGAYTAIASPEGRLAVSPFANPLLATAGSGDVLAGLIVGLLAQGLAPAQAAMAGVYLHGLVAEGLREEIGDAGVLAGDLLPEIPKTLRSLGRV